MNWPEQWTETEGVRFMRLAIGDLEKVVAICPGLGRHKKAKRMIEAGIASLQNAIRELQQ